MENNTNYIDFLLYPNGVGDLFKRAKVTADMIKSGRIMASSVPGTKEAYIAAIDSYLSDPKIISNTGVLRTEDDVKKYLSNLYFSNLEDVKKYLIEVKTLLLVEN